MLNTELVFLSLLFSILFYSIILKIQKNITCEKKGKSVDLLLFKSCAIDFIMHVNLDVSVLYLHKIMLLG